jgi:hypothetical protein
MEASPRGNGQYTVNMTGFDKYSAIWLNIVPSGGRTLLGARKATFMIFGAHVILYSKDAAADRAFCRDVLGFASVDAGHGWLIFALPPAEMAVHPAEEPERHELFLMCDDLKAEIVALGEKGVRVTDPQEARWGSIAKIRLPGGGEIGLYQPKHPTALALTSR